MRVTSVWTRAIWSDGRHNAFPGIARCGEFYYAAFRNSEGHKEPTSRIFVIRAPAGDLSQWEKVADFDLGGDARDPLVCAAGDHLHVFARVAVRPGLNPSF